MEILWLTSPCQEPCNYSAFNGIDFLDATGLVSLVRVFHRTCISSEPNENAPKRMATLLLFYFPRLDRTFGRSHSHLFDARFSAAIQASWQRTPVRRARHLTFADVARREATVPEAPNFCRPGLSRPLPIDRPNSVLARVPRRIGPAARPREACARGQRETSAVASSLHNANRRRRLEIALGKRDSATHPRPRSIALHKKEKFP